MRKTLTALLIITLFIISCSKSSGGGGGGFTVDCSIVTNKAFAADVNPIVQSTCNSASCHASGSINGPGALTNYTQFFNARSAIRAAIAAGTMPQGISLSTAQRSSIICWIDSGAPNN